MFYNYAEISHNFQVETDQCLDLSVSFSLLKVFLFFMFSEVSQYGIDVVVIIIRIYL